MSIASVLCLVDGGDGSEGSLASALEVGRSMNAYVEVLHVELDPENAVPLAADGMTASMIEEIVDSVEQESKRRAEAARDVYQKLVLDADLKAVEPGTVSGGFAVAWRSERGREHDVVARRGALFDLIVVARRGSAEEPAVTPTLETALMESGRPVLVTTPRPPKSLGKRVAVAWRDSVPGVHALAYAMPFLKAAEAVTVITVGDGETRADPRDIVSYLAHHAVKAEAESVSAGGREAGAALLEAASGADADLLVMGAYAHSRLRQLILGGVTSTVLRQADIPLLLAH